MSNLEDLISQTQQDFENLITKPKLTEKLLSRPPFRFIHDIVTNTLQSTGFPDGLFQGPELDAKSIKVSFLLMFFFSFSLLLFYL